MNITCPCCRKEEYIDPVFTGQQKKCSVCGKDFEIINPKLAPCPDCFSLISKRALTCPKCGAPLDPEFQTVSPKDDLQQEKKLEVYHPAVMNYFWWILLGIITVPILIGIFILLYIYIERESTSYELTTHRVIVRRGWIAKIQNEIWIKDMRGVNLEQGFWQRILRIGNIAIGTAASADTEIRITGISNPANVVTRINSLR